MGKIQIHFAGSCGQNDRAITDYAGWSFIVLFCDKGQKYIESGVVRARSYGQEEMAILGATYHAFAMAMSFLLKNDIRESDIVAISSDQTAVNQINGRYRIKKGLYLPFADRALRLMRDAETLENRMLINWRRFSEIKEVIKSARNAMRDMRGYSYTIDSRTEKNLDFVKFKTGKTTDGPFFIANKIWSDTV